MAVYENFLKKGVSTSYFSLNLPEGWKEPEDWRETIDEIFNEVLSDREKLVLTSRFDLNDTGKISPLKTVGAEIGVTTERVRQIQEAALRKLRKPKYVHIFELGLVEYQRREEEFRLKPAAEVSKNVLETPIEDFNFSVRSFNCLKRARINTLGDLLALTQEELLNLRNLGYRSAYDIEAKLEILGYSLKSSE